MYVKQLHTASKKNQHTKKLFTRPTTRAYTFFYGYNIYLLYIRRNVGLSVNDESRRPLQEMNEEHECSDRKSHMD
jgi:hypothetical protein